MTSFEKVLIILCSLFGLLSFFEIPYSSDLSTISFTTLALVYLLFSFCILSNVSILKAFNKESYLNISWLRIISNIIMGLWVYSVSVASLLFLVNNWDGKKVMLLTSLLSLSILLLILILNKVIKFFIDDKNFLLLRTIYYILLIGISYILTQ